MKNYSPRKTSDVLLVYNIKNIKKNNKKVISTSYKGNARFRI